MSRDRQRRDDDAEVIDPLAGISEEDATQETVPGATSQMADRSPPPKAAPEPREGGAVQDPLSFSTDELADLHCELRRSKQQQAKPQAPSDAGAGADGRRVATNGDAAGPPCEPEHCCDDAIEASLASNEDERAQQQVQPRESLASAHTTSAAGASPIPSTKAGLRAAVLAAVASEVEAGRRHDRPSRRTVASIYAEAEQRRRKLLKDNGHIAVYIPNRDQRLQSAISSLFGLMGEGRPLSARRAAWEAGLVGKAGAKLAYRVPIKSADVITTTCLMQHAPFVRLLRQDPGWLQQVTGKHKNLSALAKTLENARRSLASGAESQSYGSWHDEARALKAAGWSGNRIARRFGLNVKTVESFVRRERLKAKQR